MWCRLELEQFYGKLKSPAGMAAEHNRNSQSDPAAQNGTLGNRTDNSEHTGTMDADSPDIIAVLADQVALLKSPLESDLFSLPSCEPIPDSVKLS